MQYTRDAGYRVEKETFLDTDGKLVKEQSYTYDSKGNVVSEVVSDNEQNKETKHTYDAAGNVLTTVYADGSGVSYTYNSRNQVASETINGIATTTYTYYPNGNVAKESYQNAEDDTKQITKIYNYDKNWNVVTIDDSASGITTYEYDQYHQVTAVTDALGSRTAYTYDIYGNVASITDANHNTTQYVYDSAGNLVKETNALGEITSYTYDGSGKVKSMARQADSASTAITLATYAYDSYGNTKSVTDACGQTSTYEYDLMGNLTTVKDSEGAVVTKYTYDVQGNVLTSEDSYGTITANTYDLMGNVTHTESTAGTRDNADNESLTGAGNENQTADTGNGLTRTYKYEYDQMGRLLKAVDAENGISRQTFDVNGNVTSVISPLEEELNTSQNLQQGEAGSHKTAYQYDKNNQLVKETNAIGMTSQYTYDAKTLRLSQTEESGTDSNGEQTSRTKHYTYDELGRITSFTDSEGTVNYTYDNCGNILAVSEVKADGSEYTIERTYDALNRVSTYRDVYGNKISYTYDMYGNLKTMTYPDGSVVSYDTYDNGQLKSVTDNEGKVTTYTYDKNGRLITQTRADKSVETRTYDTAGNLTSQSTKDSEGILLQEITYTYNGFGEVTSKKKVYGETAERVNGEVEETANKTQDESEANADNDEETVAEETTAVMEYNAANQLVSYNGEKVTYDAYGNMTYGPLNGSMAEYIYDSRNRLVQVLDITYEYDAENNRISSKNSQTGRLIRYIHNTNSSLSQLLVEDDGTQKKVYTYGNDLLTSRTYQGETLESTYVYHYDNLESTTLLTDASGTPVQTYDYDAYGSITSGNASYTSFLYNGGLGVATDETGLYYMRARYYNVDIKRFINQDVVTGDITNSSSLNRYAYVQGNPVNLNDPYGLSPELMASDWGLSVMQGIYNIANFIVDLTPIGTVKSAYNCYQAIKRGDTKEAIREGFSVAIDVVLFFTGGKIIKKAEKVLAKGVKALKNIVKSRKAVSRTAKVVKESTKLAEAANKLRKLAGKAGEKIAGAGKFVSSKLHRSKTVKRNEPPRQLAMKLDLQLFAEKKVKSGSSSSTLKIN